MRETRGETLISTPTIGIERKPTTAALRDSEIAQVCSTGSNYEK